MTAAAYRDLLLRQWYVVAVCALALGIGALLGSFLVHPLYQSTARLEANLRLGTSPANLAIISGSDRVLQTDVALATSLPVLQAAASQIPGVTVEQLSGTISAAAVPNTDIIEISVVDGSPTRAATLANAVAAAMIDQQQQVLQQDNANSQSQVQQQLTEAQRQLDATSASLRTLQTTSPKSDLIAQLLLQQTSQSEQVAQIQATLSRIQTAEAESESATLLHVIQSAQPAPSPIRPYHQLSLAGGLAAGLLLGLLVVALRAQLDQRLRSAPAVAEELGWPLLAETERLADAQTEGDALYHTLVDGLAFAGIETPLVTIGVLQLGTGETGSHLAAGLAHAMAAQGMKTLLVEADLYHPSRQTLTDAEAREGFSTAALAARTTPHGAAMLGQFLHTADTSLPALRVIPTGPLPPNPAEVLASSAVRTLLAMLRTSGAEAVIVDPPTLHDFPAANVLAAQVDGVVLVVDLAQARRDQLLRAKRQLTEAGVHVVGCVVSAHSSREGTSGRRRFGTVTTAEASDVPFTTAAARTATRSEAR